VVLLASMTLTWTWTWTWIDFCHDSRLVITGAKVDHLLLATAAVGNTCGIYPELPVMFKQKYQSGIGQGPHVTVSLSLPLAHLLDL